VNEAHPGDARSRAPVAVVIDHGGTLEIGPSPWPGRSVGSFWSCPVFVAHQLSALVAAVWGEAE
jgi:hypothetical protein